MSTLAIGTVAEPPDLSSDKIAVIVGLNGDDVQSHIAALGVEPVESEGEVV